MRSERIHRNCRTGRSPSPGFEVRSPLRSFRTEGAHGEKARRCGRDGALGAWALRMGRVIRELWDRTDRCAEAPDSDSLHTQEEYLRGGRPGTEIFSHPKVDTGDKGCWLSGRIG